MRSKDGVQMNPKFKLSIKGDAAEDLGDRFRDAKERSRTRLGRKELTHGEFLKLLLDVWEEYEEPRRIKSGT